MRTTSTTTVTTAVSSKVFFEDGVFFAEVVTEARVSLPSKSLVLLHSTIRRSGEARGRLISHRRIMLTAEGCTLEGIALEKVIAGEHETALAVAIRSAEREEAAKAA